MKTTYDPNADALAIQFASAKGGAVRTREVESGVSLDFDEEGKLLGLEVLDASQHFTAAALAKIASAGDQLTLEAAEKEFGLSAETWRKLLQRMRVKGTKVGTTWTISRAAAANYLESRSARGRPATKKKARRAKVRA